MSSLTMHLIPTILVAFNSCVNGTEWIHACAISYKKIVGNAVVVCGPLMTAIEKSIKVT